MRWTWDEAKNQTNKRNHRLSFGTAQLVFDDPLAASRVDPHPDGDRWQTALGASFCSLSTCPRRSIRPPVMRLAASSVPAKQRRMKGELMKKATSSHKLTAARKAELEVLAAMPDTEIDTSEMPEQTD